MAAQRWRNAPSRPKPPSGVRISLAWVGDTATIASARAIAPDSGFVPAEPFVVTPARAEVAEPRTVGETLVGDVVQRQHTGDRAIDGSERGAGVPVVEVDDVGSGRLDDRGDRLAEREEATVVVRPTVTIGLQVRVRARQSRSLDDAERTNVRVHAAANTRRAGPRRHGELVGRRVAELDAAVVGHHHVDVDALPA